MDLEFAGGYYMLCVPGTNKQACADFYRNLDLAWQSAVYLGLCPDDEEKAKAWVVGVQVYFHVQETH